MKKKARLFFSVILLIFCISVFGWGVYAASSVSISITNTVTFKTMQLFVDIEGNVKKGTGIGTATQIVSEDENDSFVLSKISNYTVDAQTNEKTELVAEGDANVNLWHNEQGNNVTEWETTSVVLDETNKYVEYNLTFTNQSIVSITVIPNITLFNTEANRRSNTNGITLEEYEQNNSSNIVGVTATNNSISIEPNQTGNFKIAFTVQKFSVNLDNLSFTANFDIKRTVDLPQNSVQAGIYVVPTNVNSIDISTAQNIPQSTKYIVLLDNITEINSGYMAGAFMNNKNIEGIIVGSNVTKIGNLAFVGCDNLKSITFKGSAPKIAYDSFGFGGMGNPNYSPFDTIRIILPQDEELAESYKVQQAPQGSNQLSTSNWFFYQSKLV